MLGEFWQFVLFCGSIYSSKVSSLCMNHYCTSLLSFWYVQVCSGILCFVPDIDHLFLLFFSLSCYRFANFTDLCKRKTKKQKNPDLCFTKFLKFCVHDFINIISVLLLTLDLFSSSFSKFLWGGRDLRPPMWGFSSLPVYTFSAISFPFGIALAVSHKF